MLGGPHRVRRGPQHRQRVAGVAHRSRAPSTACGSTSTRQAGCGATRSASASACSATQVRARCSPGVASATARTHVGSRADSAEHQQAGQARGVGTGDVGVQPVADDERRLKIAAAQRVHHQRRLRLARHLGLAVRSPPAAPPPSSRCRAAGRARTAASGPRSRRPTGRRHGWPAPPRPDRPSRSAASVPARRRPGRRRTAGPVAARRCATSSASASVPTTRTADAGRQLVGQQVRRTLRAGDDVIGFGAGIPVPSGARRRQRGRARRCW